MRSLRIPAMLVALAALAGACTNKSLGTEPTGPQIGQAGEVSSVDVIPAPKREDRPSFAGEDLDGNRIRSSDLRGSVVLVNFWASWCPPCRKEQPILERVWRSYKDRGVRFVGIDLRDSRTAARAMVEEFGVTYPSIFNPDSSIAAVFKLLIPPSTFILDREGRIAARILGAVAEDRELTTAIDEVLRG